MNDVLTPPPSPGYNYGYGARVPGGSPAPWNNFPPNNTGGGQPVRPINFNFGHGQLPSDTGDLSTPGAGDTQVGNPTTTAPPVAPTYTFAAGQALIVDYVEAGASVTTVTEGIDPPPIRIYLGAGASGPAIAGSVRFVFRGRTYVDRAGSLYYAVDPITNAGTLGGSYDYSGNVATLTDYAAAGGNTVNIVSLCTRNNEPGCSGVMFRTPGAPLRPGSFTIRATTMAGVELTGSVDINGTISGTEIKGNVDWQTGLTRVAFGAMVTAAGNESEPWYDADLISAGNIWRPTPIDPASIFFGTVIYHSIPVDPELIGIDPVRLPTDGRVLGFNSGGVAIVSHTQLTSIASPAAADVTDLGRDRIGFVEIVDSLGEPIDSAWYALDLTAGTITWADPLNLSAYTLPVKVRDRIQDKALIADVQITGQITLATPVTHDYPAGTIISAAILYQDVQARYTNLFDQATYSASTWSDTVEGAEAGAQYNDTTYPVAVENDAAIDQRWKIRFRSPTTVDVIGETVGQILSGVSITSDIAPINPVTISVSNPSGTPYFTIDADGWGGGWSADNVVRFNTVSATRPPWLARVVTPGDIAVANDAVRINVYGNAH